MEILLLTKRNVLNSLAQISHKLVFLRSSYNLQSVLISFAICFPLIYVSYISVYISVVVFWHYDHWFHLSTLITSTNQNLFQRFIQPKVKLANCWAAQFTCNRYLPPLYAINFKSFILYEMHNYFFFCDWSFLRLPITRKYLMIYSSQKVCTQNGCRGKYFKIVSINPSPFIALLCNTDFDVLNMTSFI